jgi:class 3 adenylate cyclase/YHS domain-containing protein
VETELAILMADLTGYTAMTDVHGGASAAKVVSKYMEIVDAAIHGTAKAVQRIGDQVVMIAENSSDILETATKLSRLTSEEHQFLSIHAGLHYGKILIEKDNLFGSTINVASRIMNIANRGQILCSASFIEQLPTQSGTMFRSIGVHKLKNLINNIELFELQRTTSDALHIDPVCHMHVSVYENNPSLDYNGVTYCFCSDHCRSLFLQAPEQFIESKT